MKNILLPLFLFLSLSLFSQKNEISISYQPSSDNIFGNQSSLSYYRALGEKTAIGVRASLRIYDSKTQFDNHKNLNYSSRSIDILSRWNFIRNKKIRISGEIGFSLKRELGSSFTMILDPLFCGVIDSGFPHPLIPHVLPHSELKNDFGYTSGLNMDFYIFKNLFIGANYNLQVFKESSSTPSEDLSFSSIFKFNIGTQF